MKKYPIEIEITDFCSLRCRFCVNPLLKDKGFISVSDFNKIIQYIYNNRDNILYVNVSGIGDIFLHPQINSILDSIINNFRGVNIPFLIPTKGNSVTDDHFKKLIRMKQEGINVNISVGIYSIYPKINNLVMGKDIFYKIINFLKKCYHNKLYFSLELLNNNISEKEKIAFNKLISALNIGGSIAEYHNFGGQLESINNIGCNVCSFAGEKYVFSDFYCSFIPMIAQNMSIYTCSISGKDSKFYIGDFKELINKFPDYLELVTYIKTEFLSSEKCKKCSIYKKHYEKTESTFGSHRL